mgnify:CR=1 FL=1
MGNITNYNHQIQLTEEKEGFVRVRKSPIWSGTDKTNVIGRLKSGMVLPAWGPVKNRPSYGIGFVVPLKDSEGKTCRGYISRTVIKQVRCDAFKTAKLFKAFPRPLDSIPGPCTGK